MACSTSSFITRHTVVGQSDPTGYDLYIALLIAGNKVDIQHTHISFADIQIISIASIHLYKHHCNR